MWLIDVSQSVEPTYPHGLEFLFRDCRNVSTVTSHLTYTHTHTTLFFVPSEAGKVCVCLCTLQFFQKRGVSEAMSMYELFNAVSGLNIPVCDEVEAEFVAKVILSES